MSSDLSNVVDSGLPGEGDAVLILSCVSILYSCEPEFVSCGMRAKDNSSLIRSGNSSGDL